jgi:hypothetical protein
LPVENKWRYAANRRLFMDEYAASKGFDPLVPDNWYNIKGDDIIEAQVFRLVVDSIFVLILFVFLVLLLPSSFLRAVLCSASTIGRLLNWS